MYKMSHHFWHEKNLETSLQNSLFPSIKNNIRLKQNSSKDYFRQKSENCRSQLIQYCGVRFFKSKASFGNLNDEHIFKMNYNSLSSDPLKL